MPEPDFRPPQHQASASRLVRSMVVIAIVCVAAYVAWMTKGFWWPSDSSQEVPVAASLPVQAVVVPPPEPEEKPPAELIEQQVMPEGPLHPVALEKAAEASQKLTSAVFDQSVIDWLGRSALKYLVVPELANNIVATIDNLPRNHAAVRLWPIAPVGGKIELEQSAQGWVISPKNSARYDAVIDFLTQTEPAQLARWYRQTYPLLQTIYEELGYPNLYFNDRVVEVIDHLRQTPEPEGPLKVDLVQVQGVVPSLRPWVRYEFVDEDLQALSAGQKIMLRVGAKHRAQLKEYLLQLRTQIAQ